MRGPSRDQLLSETARLAYHFHWPLDTILDLEHADRHRFLAEAESLAVGSISDPPAGGDPRGDALVSGEPRGE
jgi:hypothetical protein